MHPLIRVARQTGLFYLGLAVAGALGFLLIRSRLFVADDPTATLSNLLAHDSLARAGIAFELLTVLTQALAAAWFYRLFHAADRYRAAAIAAFGLANALAVLTSAALLATALESAQAGDPATTVQLLYRLSGHVWSVGGLFFGLWLIPMGWSVLTTGWMPRLLGWVLIVGGCCFVLGAYVRYLVPGSDAAADALAYPATVGEFWMIGYLLVFGIRRTALDHPPATHPQPRPDAAAVDPVVG
jgi:hypothetical protein